MILAAAIFGNADKQRVTVKAYIDSEVAEMYKKRLKELKGIVAKRHAEEDAWAKNNPDKAEKQKAWFENMKGQINQFLDYIILRSIIISCYRFSMRCNYTWIILNNIYKCHLYLQFILTDNYLITLHTPH